MYLLFSKFTALLALLLLLHYKIQNGSQFTFHFILTDQAVVIQSLQNITSISRKVCFFTPALVAAFSLPLLPQMTHMHPRIQIDQCPVLRPTWKEFRHFSAFVEKVQREYKHEYGMVKVVPPEQWSSNFPDYQNRLQQLAVTSPIEQIIQGKAGLYQCLHIAKRSMGLREYRKKIATSDQSTQGLSAEAVEEMFWANILFSPPLYGADLVNTLMDEHCGEWNLNSLDSLLRQAVPENLRGVTSSYCYVGSWKSLFCWHKEDLDLSAINYLHEGKSKFWYSIPEGQGELLERQAKRYFPEQFSKCSQHFRHKTTLINPYLLKSTLPQLRISKIEQHPGQFMLVLGGSYHCGFNFGYNIAEAINYATLSWLQRLPHVKHCLCSKDSVKIDPHSVLANLASSGLDQTQQFADFKQTLMQLQAQEETKKEKVLKRKLRQKITKEKKRPQRVVVKETEYKIESWAQCELCEVWRRVNGNYQNRKFICRMAKKQCHQKEHYSKDGMIIL